MNSFKYLVTTTIAVFLVGCSLENSVSPSAASGVPGAPENVAAVTTPQGEIQTVKTPDGSLCIFMRGANNRLYYKKQNSATGFPSTWTQVGGTSTITGNIATYCSGAYPVYVFSINANSNLVMSKQTVNNGSWSTWQVIGGTSFQINSDIVVAGDWDGKINVFARKSSDNNLYYLFQNSPNGSWPTVWSQLYNEPVHSKIAVLKHTNFSPTTGLTVFFGTETVRPLSKRTGGETYAIHALHQFATVGWVYDDMDGDNFGTSSVIVANNLADGRMMVMGLNSHANMIKYCYESTIGSQGWAPHWQFGEGGAKGPLALAKNTDGRLELFFNRILDLEGNYYLMHKWQDWSGNPESWSAAEPVGNFPTIDYYWNNGNADIPIGTKIVADQFQNGTLVAFAQTSAFSGSPIGYTYFNCNYPLCWMPGPISLGNP